MANSPDPTDVHIGSRVRLRRMLNGLSQTDLGRAAGGITFQQIQKYEKGRNRIGGSRLKMIADVLGVPPSYFFEDMPTDGAEAPFLPTAKIDIEIAKAAHGLSIAGREAVLAMIVGLKAEGGRVAA
jgi:transcriptional regulator with XRE-family HTH domain